MAGRAFLSFGYGRPPGLPDKIGPAERLFLGDAELLLAKGDALHEKRHVAGQRAHDLQTLAVLHGLARRAATTLAPTFMLLSKRVL